VRVDPFGTEVVCAEGETILAAVLRNGYFVRYGCKYGGCGTCRALLVEGDVRDSGSSFALPDPVRAQGWVLSCSSTPLGDCAIDVSAMELSEEEFLGGDTVATMRASLASIESLTPTIYGVTLHLVDPPSISFAAGQFVNVVVPGRENEAARAFSIASSPADSSVVELIVKRLPGGRFGQYLESAPAGAALRLHGPLGSLRARPSYRKMIMVAGGSGLAPLLSILTDLAQKQDRRAIVLFFGARTPDELYRLDRIRRLCETSANLSFVPVVQYPQPGWQGETGMVTTAVARRMPDLRGHDAYICGPPPMVMAARDLVLELGVRLPNIYSDAFTPARPAETTLP
jgi:NAD(P)H-flavin reductase/ferredoxin